MGCVGARSACGAPAAIGLGEFSSQIAAARHLAEACDGAAAACDPAALPRDADVRGNRGTMFRASWLWLREAVGAAKGASAENRVRRMQEAEAHLQEWKTQGELEAQADALGQAGASAAFGKAQRAATEVLARGEFRANAGPTWLDRQLARIQDWIVRLLLGMDRLGAHNPWVAPLVEWGCFLLAAGGLMFFIRRSLARGALRIALAEDATAAHFSGRDATDWARLAEERGVARDWREGIHCLYWAAIVSLESRRAWRPNPTRTPREYVRLLARGSAARDALGGLTHHFEQIWYGQAEAVEAEFRAAQAAFAEITSLAAADLQRRPPIDLDRRADPAPVGAA